MKLLARIRKWCISELDNISFMLIATGFIITDSITKQANKMKLFKDLDDNQFWMTLWSFAFVLAMAITTGTVWVSWQEDKFMTELIKAGHDPLELSCLYNTGNVVEMPCTLLAQEKAKTYVTE